MERAITLKIRDRKDKDEMVRILASAEAVFKVESGWQTEYVCSAPDMWKVTIYKD